jgi:hypothetical protein
VHGVFILAQTVPWKYQKAELGGMQDWQSVGRGVRIQYFTLQSAAGVEGHQRQN